MRASFMKLLLIGLLYIIWLFISVQPFATRVSYNNGDMTFHSLCMVNMAFQSTQQIQSSLNNHHVQIHGSPEEMACAFESLRKRGQANDIDIIVKMHTYLAGIAKHHARHDIRAYFYNYLAENGDSSARQILAELYAKGQGVPKNLQTAEDLYLQDAFSHFFINPEMQKCVHSLDLYSDLASHPLHIEQFDKLKKLCTLPPEKIHLAALEYLKNGKHQIAKKLLRDLYLYYNYQDARDDLINIKN